MICERCGVDGGAHPIEECVQVLKAEVASLRSFQDRDLVCTLYPEFGLRKSFTARTRAEALMLIDSCLNLSPTGTVLLVSGVDAKVEALFGVAESESQVIDKLAIAIAQNEGKEYAQGRADLCADLAKLYLDRGEHGDSELAVFFARRSVELQGTDGSDPLAIAQEMGIKHGLRAFEDSKG